MRKNFKNSVSVQGYIFDHKLEARTSRKGVDYIGGVMNVATDKSGTSIVPVWFTYVTKTYRSGKTNQNYNTLLNIIEKGTTIKGDGAENALLVRINGDLEVNDFINNDDEAVSSQRVRGSFIHTATDEKQITPGASFDVEFLATKCLERELNDETFVEMSGYVFDFRNQILPCKFAVRSPEGMSFFLDQDISSSKPYFNRVWGDIVCTTISRKSEVESAFGAPMVRESSFNRRSWDITGASAEPLDFGDPDVITIDDIKAAMVDREAHLQDVRERHDEYVKSREGGASGAAKSAFGSAAPKKKADAPFDDDFDF